MDSKSNCKHEKVYANYILTSNPPQSPWICKKCGAEGVDVETNSKSFSEYDALKTLKGCDNYE